MLGLITGLLSDATAPLIQSAADFGARLARKLILFLVAGLCLLVMLLALTIAFDLWIASLAGPIVGALAVAGVYLTVAIVAIVLALRDVPPAPEQPPVADQPDTAKASVRHPETDARIDQFTAPILDMLQRFGLQREQLAVFAGASFAKRLGPLPLVGCAIVVGFLVGRMWKSWRQVLETVLAASPLIAEFLNSRPQPEPPTS